MTIIINLVRISKCEVRKIFEIVNSVLGINIEIIKIKKRGIETSKILKRATNIFINIYRVSLSWY